MAEVMLTLELACGDARREAFAAAMKKLRWVPVPHIESTWTCFFEASFIYEVRRIVAQDVRDSARSAKIAGWRGAHTLSSIATFEDAAEIDRAPEELPPTELWTDAGVSVGPTSEVMLTLEVEPSELDAMHRALAARHWKRLEGLGATWAHRFDLGIFKPVADIVAPELRIAAATAGVERWRAAWSLSSWECTVIGTRESAERPYESWRLQDPE